LSKSGAPEYQVAKKICMSIDDCELIKITNKTRNIIYKDDDNRGEYDYEKVLYFFVGVRHAGYILPQLCHDQ
jgi:hypothetical protein